MKKFVSKGFAMILAGVLAVSAVGSVGAAEEVGSNGEVNVYNWGEYMPDGVDGSVDLIEKFEQETGIKVNYKEYDSNETLYAELKPGNTSYDVIIPSDYMISRMIEEDMLEKLNFDNIPNYKNIMDAYKNSDDVQYDPTGEYSVPFSWGTVAIVYNKTMVDEPVDSWDIFWDEKYAGQILMFDNSRDAFGIALKKLGYSQNTTNEAELEAAAEELRKQKPLVQAYVMDQIFDKMGNGEAAVAPYYAGDIITMMAENPDLAYAFPKEGTNRFVDAMAIPKGAPNKENAEAFINFMCDAENAAAVAEYIGYSTPNQAAYELLDEEITGNPIAYPDDSLLAKTEFFVNLPADINQKMQDLWVSVKTADTSTAGGTSAWVIAVIIAAVVVVIAAIFLIPVLRKNAGKKKVANRKK